MRKLCPEAGPRIEHESLLDSNTHMLRGLNHVMGWLQVLTIFNASFHIFIFLVFIITCQWPIYMFFSRVLQLWSFPVPNLSNCVHVRLLGPQISPPESSVLENPKFLCSLLSKTSTAYTYSLNMRGILIIKDPILKVGQYTVSILRAMTRRNESEKEGGRLSSLRRCGSFVSFVRPLLV